MLLPGQWRSGVSVREPVHDDGYAVALRLRGRNITFLGLAPCSGARRDTRPHPTSAPPSRPEVRAPRVAFPTLCVFPSPRTVREPLCRLAPRHRDGSPDQAYGTSCVGGSRAPMRERTWSRMGFPLRDTLVPHAPGPLPSWP